MNTTVIILIIVASTISIFGVFLLIRSVKIHNKKVHDRLMNLKQNAEKAFTNDSVAFCWSKFERYKQLHPNHDLLFEIYQILKNKEIEEEWFEITDDKPTECVLVACETYDCGWTIDSAWWCESKNNWMATGTVSGGEECHLPYTHWKPLPSPPNVKSQWD